MDMELKRIRLGCYRLYALIHKEMEILSGVELYQERRNNLQVGSIFIYLCIFAIRYYYMYYTAYERGAVMIME